jgi:ribulose-phosphate 3-epimerase
MQSGTHERVGTARFLADQGTRRIPIAVDGGVKSENATTLVQAGADILIMGTALFQANNMAETVRSIRASIEESPRH